MKRKIVNSIKELRAMRGVPIFKNREECLEKEMTEKQRTVFLVIDEWWKEYGYGPSIDDIMYQTGDKGRANVQRQIKALCDLGICKRLPNRARSVRPVYVNFRNV
jgi:SOS-response transcriptional repressor LexA